MGRKRNPISDPGPIGTFAQRLRDRMDEVMPKLTFRAMADVTYVSHSVLAEACSGTKLPTWPVTKAFVTACGATEAEVGEWKKDWLETQRSVGQLRRKLGEAGVVVPTHSDTGQPLRAGRLRPVLPDLADPDACVPRPEKAQTFDDLAYQVRVLKIAVGNPSLRLLRAHLRKRDYPVSVSTLSDVINGRRTPTRELLEIIVKGLLTYDEEPSSRTPGRPWSAWQTWRDAWSRAEFNRERPDLIRRNRLGNVYLLSDNQDEGPTASIVAEMAVPAAAALLASLHPPLAAGILNELPPRKQQAVVTAMFQQQTGGSGPEQTANDERGAG
jgi:Helix-turn-helix domain